MDEFAQSRADDDLFGDEFEPVSTPTIIHDGTQNHGSIDDHDGSSSRATGSSQSRGGTEEGGGRGGQRNVQGQVQNHGRSRGGHRAQERGRVRGQGQGQGGRGGFQTNTTGLAGSRYAPQQPTAATVPTIEDPTRAQAADTTDITTNSNSNSNDTTTSMNTTGTTITEDTRATNTDQTSLSDAPTQPSQQQPQQPSRTTAVRGDRSLTGGPQHTKLSEEELTAKLARMAILNAEKTAKFRRTEADSAAFLQKEAEMRKKRVEEQKNARAMDQERARNRERKLKAQGGREWDSEKVESDIVDGRGRGRSSEYVRGGHGGVIRGAGGLGGSRFADTAGGKELQASRGRGGFEVRGRGIRGRGGRGGKAIPPSVPTDADFPSLPTPAKSVAANETIKSPTAEKGPHDWAEEMATPVDEKKIDV